MLLILITAFLVENFVRDVLAVPLLHAVWVARLMLESIPQGLLWVGLVLAGIVLAARAVERSRWLPQRVIDGEPAMRRVEDMARLLHQAHTDRFSRWRLAQHLGGLVVEVLADEQRISQREVHRQVERGALAISPDLQAYLRARLSTVRPGGRFGPGRTTTAQDLDPEEIVQFLEERIRHDTGGMP